jgi:hypothetical protein
MTPDYGLQPGGPRVPTIGVESFGSADHTQQASRKTSISRPAFRDACRLTQVLVQVNLNKKVLIKEIGHFL